MLGFHPISGAPISGLQDAAAVELTPLPSISIPEPVRKPAYPASLQQYLAYTRVPDAAPATVEQWYPSYPDQLRRGSLIPLGDVTLCPSPGIHFPLGYYPDVLPLPAPRRITQSLAYNPALGNYAEDAAWDRTQQPMAQPRPRLFPGHYQFLAFPDQYSVPVPEQWTPVYAHTVKRFAQAVSSGMNPAIATTRHFIFWQDDFAQSPFGQ